MDSNSNSLEDAKKYIYSINFDKIINKMVLIDGWIKIDAVKTCEMFRNFLFLNKKYHSFSPLVPSKDIDEFWHFLILDTPFYREINSALFPNSFLDHYQYFGMDGVTDSKSVAKAFAATQKLYIKEFSTPIIRTRSKFPRFVYWILKRIT